MHLNIKSECFLMLVQYVLFYGILNSIIITLINKQIMSQTWFKLIYLTVFRVMKHCFLLKDTLEAHHNQIRDRFKLCLLIYYRFYCIPSISKVIHKIIARFIDLNCYVYAFYRVLCPKGPILVIHFKHL
jgi:hypothetical protein